MRYHTAFSHATYIHFSVFFVPCVTTVFCILWARQASDTSLRHKQHEFTLFVEQFVLFVACINAVLQTSYYYRSILVGLVVCGLLYKVYIPYILCGSIYPLQQSVTVCLCVGSYLFILCLVVFSVGQNSSFIIAVSMYVLYLYNYTFNHINLCTPMYNNNY